MERDRKLEDEKVLAKGQSQLLGEMAVDVEVRAEEVVEGMIS